MESGGVGGVGGGGGGGDDWNPFAEKQKDKLLKFVSSVCQQIDDEAQQLLQIKYHAAVSAAAARASGQSDRQRVDDDDEDSLLLPQAAPTCLQPGVPQVVRPRVESIACLTSFHSFASTERKLSVPRQVWYFHDEPKSRISTRM